MIGGRSPAHHEGCGRRIPDEGLGWKTRTEDSDGRSPAHHEGCGRRIPDEGLGWKTRTEDSDGRSPAHHERCGRRIPAQARLRYLMRRPASVT